jgi:hypothetical protein
MEALQLASLSEVYTKVSRPVGVLASSPVFPGVVV